MIKQKNFIQRYLSVSGLMNPVMILIALMVFEARLSAQNTSLTKESLTGTWLLDYNKSKQKMTENVKKQLDRMNSGQRNQVESSYTERKLAFEDGGRLTILLKDGTEIKANWELNERRQIITIKDGQGKARTYSIPEYKNGKLVLKVRTNSTQTLPFITEWHLKKQ